MASAGAVSGATGSVVTAASRLVAEGVCVQFEGLRALDGVSLTLGQGEIVGLIGPNGAGKTTFINVLTGFQKCTSGSFRLDPGGDLTRKQPENIARAGIARTFQQVRLFRGFTVAENIEAAAIGCGRSLRTAAAICNDLLDWLELRKSAERQADTLPYGDERRIGIARALAADPLFLLLDEPAAGLNEEEAGSLMRTIHSIPEKFGCGVLLIEHNMRVVMGVCSRIQVINFGRPLAHGSPREIQSHPEVRRAYLGGAV